MQINFSKKELEVIELLNPGKSAEETCNAILRNWFDVTTSRMHASIKTKDQIVDDIIKAKKK